MHCVINSLCFQLLQEQGVNLRTTAEHQICRDIKEQHCYVAQDFESELQKSETCLQLEEAYRMPDGQVIGINGERFRYDLNFVILLADSS